MANFENDYNGDIRISDDVLATLAVKAAKEVDGVSGMVGGLVGKLTAVLGKKDTGVDVDMKDGVATITLHIKVRYGVKIPEVAWKAQEKVKSMIESVTGITVEKVNVSVEAIDFGETSSSKADSSAEDPEILDIDVTD